MVALHPNAQLLLSFEAALDDRPSVVRATPASVLREAGSPPTLTRAHPRTAAAAIPFLHRVRGLGRFMSQPWMSPAAGEGAGHLQEGEAAFLEPLARNPSRRWSFRRRGAEAVANQPPRRSSLTSTASRARAPAQGGEQGAAHGPLAASGRVRRTLSVPNLSWETRRRALSSPRTLHQEAVLPRRAATHTEHGGSDGRQ